MNIAEEMFYKAKGIDPKAKSAYVALFNSKSEVATKVLDDLVMRFKFYGAPPSRDPYEVVARQAQREVLEYILTMSCRISDDTLEEIQKFINR